MAKEHAGQFNYRGAVRPPFIEGGKTMAMVEEGISYRGAVRPPFIEGIFASGVDGTYLALSGGSPPPLH